MDGQRTNHVWDGSQQIVADVIDSDYYEAQCYIRGTSLAATYRYQNAVKSGYTYYVQNAHGDVVNLTDAEGAVTKTYRYDAFGVELSPVSGDVNVFRYCGEYFDTETGTVYLRARYYQASIGRFTQRDTNPGKIGEPLSLNLYTYCHNNPICYMDYNGHEKIVVSGGLDGEENFRYSFIESAIRCINLWGNDEAITWVVANYNYTPEDMENFASTANEYGVNFMSINDKQELFDYINKEGRDQDLISTMAVYAHGTAFDVPGTIPNPEYKNQYALALGYSAICEKSHNNNLNIFSSDLSKIKSSSFISMSRSYLYSCRAGNLFNGSCFAQDWANATLGLTRAASGNGMISGRTDYSNIYSITNAEKLKALFGLPVDRVTERATYGYSKKGCKSAPSITDGGEWKYYLPNMPGH